MVDVLTENNFVVYAMHHYDNPQCTSIEEFEEDLKRIKYLKRLLRRYLSSGELRERLILNHLIVLINVFGATPAARMLFLKLEDKLHSALKTFLVYLYAMPDTLDGIDLASISLDQHIVQTLRGI